LRRPRPGVPSGTSGTTREHGGIPINDPAEVVRTLFAAIDSGDIEGALTVVDPQVELYPSAWSGGGVATGHDGIRRWLRQYGEDVSALRLEVDHVESRGDRVLVLGTAHDSRQGGEFSQRLGWVFELDNGLIFRTRSYVTWAQAREAF
jgi:ketosteroid isomerase-like protein